jgi:cytochrome b6-f complex iron-sulfur subunit
MIITPGSATIIVVRTSATAVAAVSDICTHARCGVNYDASLSLLVCPCHGSEFELNGSVARGPARTPLRVYTAALDAATNTITVTL